MAMAKLLQFHTSSSCFSSQTPLIHPVNSNSSHKFFRRNPVTSTRRRVVILATSAAPEPEKPPQKTVLKRKEKPVYSLKKGQIVRVDKEKYLNSINYLSVGHPPYFKGLDYIYEDRGEVLDLRHFETGEYALLAWVGIPTAPAWLPTYMLIKSEKLNYERV
ncbi:hypothetical protein SUGI_1197820 [Cryptomeria japonica]|nr:hypothetical protein SUGI_1197820 [Cryptomeria japonica]